MELFLRGCAAVLTGVLLSLLLGKQGKEMGLLVTMAACCMVAFMALEYLRPVQNFLAELEKFGGLDQNLTGILLKASGIGILSEIASLVCADAGNSSMGKSVQILGNAVILWLTIPLFQALLNIIRKILGEL